MAHFQVEFGKKTSLRSITSSKILIKKIRLVNNQAAINMGIPLRYSQKIGTATFSGVLVPIAYFSPNARGFSTNEPIDKVISHCKQTTFEIVPIQNAPKDLIFEVTYDPLKLILVDIFAVNEIDGFTFSLDENCKELLKSEFKYSKPIDKIFVSAKTINDFQLLHGSIFPQLAISLFGLSEEEDLNKIDYRIILEDTRRIVYDSTRL
ncbi:MAG: hypothetical protein NT084_08595 [Bacteroidetes bacterium]|nr:hypothetical protein [Bacteroidota bacterium]